MIGMPKSMMQPEAMALGAKVVKVLQEQECKVAAFEQGEHLPTGEVVRKREGTRMVGCEQERTDIPYVFHVGPWQQVTGEQLQSGAYPLHTPDATDAKAYADLLAYSQRLANTITALRAEVGKLQEGTQQLVHQRNAAYRQLNEAGLVVQPSFQGVPLKFDASFQDSMSPGHMARTALGAASGYAGAIVGAKADLAAYRAEHGPVGGIFGTAREKWGPEWGNAQKLMQRLDQPKPDADGWIPRPMERCPTAKHLMDAKRLADAEGVTTFDVAKVLSSPPGQVFHTAGLPPSNQDALDRRVLRLHFPYDDARLLSTLRPPKWQDVAGIELVE